MLRQGPFPARLHGLLEYAVGAFFVASPFIFGFDATAAIAIGVVGGVALILMAATAATGPSLAPLVPIGMHVAYDVVFAGFLIASPFILGFSDEGAPTALFIVVGVLHLLVTIGTRFVAPEPSA
ncbi:MAG: hypothetical protein WD689_00330 [Gaiellaceae bacterium]